MLAVDSGKNFHHLAKEGNGTLGGLKNWLEVYRHDYRYSISAEIIQAYHQTIEHVFISSPGVQSMGGKGYEEFESVIQRYLASQIRTEPFIQEAGSKLRLMILENQQGRLLHGGLVKQIPC